MNPYVIVESGIGTTEAASLRARLMAWHDAMVAHERRLRSGNSTDMCGEECPHVEARRLWAEASAMLGPPASELTFLRSRALGASASSSETAKSVSQAPERGTRAGAAPAASTRRPSSSFKDSAVPSRIATAEL